MVLMKFIDPHHDLWRSIAGEDGPIAAPTPRAHALLTLEQWHALREHWPQAHPVGVMLANTADVEALQSDLPRLSLIVLQFPKWTDGRAYSQAHLLRMRLRYSGELRATGEVLVDMLPLLQRTGFDAVQLRHDQDPAAAARALDFFAGHYQGDVIEPQPAFRRDTAAQLKADEQRRQSRAEAFSGEGI
jgi:uncharacterized protein (DUF934 family)